MNTICICHNRQMSSRNGKTRKGERLYPKTCVPLEMDADNDHLRRACTLLLLYNVRLTAHKAITPYIRGVP